MKVKAYPIEIDEESVIKYLRYKDKKVSEDISKEIDIAIKESSQIIDAKICYDEFKIRYDESKKQIILPDGSIFKDEYVVKNIKDADYIIMAIMTLGKEIDDKISNYFNNGDYIKGMIYDSIGVAVLDYLSKKFWQDLMKDVSKQGLGITHRLCPGDNRWDIKDQQIAGPAFEGAGITFGIGGIVGAIDHVDLSKRPIYTTIGNAKPKGICGSNSAADLAVLTSK